MYILIHYISEPIKLITHCYSNADLYNRVDSLGVHEVVLYWIFRNLFRVSEYSLPEHKFRVSPSQGRGVAGLVGDSGVLGHGNGGSLVSLPLRQHISNVVMALDEMLCLRIHLPQSYHYNDLTVVFLYTSYSAQPSTFCSSIFSARERMTS